MALDPGDPTRVVISTDVHPVSGLPLRGADGWPHHELFEAQTADVYWGRPDSSGYLWSFEPIPTPTYTSTYLR